MASKVNKYLKDIIGLTHTKSDLEQILFDCKMFAERLSYKSVLQNGSDNLDAFKQFITYQTKDIESEILRWYFEYLIVQSDITIFDPAQFKILHEELRSLAEEFAQVKIITATKLESLDIEHIAWKLSEKIGRKVVLDITIDPTIIGGAIIKKDNYIMDFSLKTKLYLFGEEWKKSISSS